PKNQIKQVKPLTTKYSSPQAIRGGMFFIVAPPPAALRPAAALSWSDTALTQRLSLVARCATRERTGLLFAEPDGAGLWLEMVLRSSRLRFSRRQKGTRKARPAPVSGTSLGKTLSNSLARAIQ